MGHDPRFIRRTAVAFMVGAALTAVSGAVVQVVIQPATDVSDETWSYPWSSDALVPVSLAYAVLHLLVAVGLVGFGRSGATGDTRAGRAGVLLAVAGTTFLLAGELLSIAVRDAMVDDAGAGLVGAVFGLGTLLSAMGLLLAGYATLTAGVWTGRARLTPLVAGVWTTVLLGLAFTKALPAGVAVYGLCLLAMAVALHAQGAPDAPVARRERQPART